MSKVKILSASIMALALTFTTTTTITNAANNSVTPSTYSIPGSDSNNPIILPGNSGTLPVIPTLPNIGEGGITPQVLGDQWSDKLSGTSTLTKFTIKPGYGHVVATINNTGDSELYFSVQHTATGKQYGNGVVQPHSTVSWRSYESVSQGLRTGENSIQFRPVGNGNSLKGTVYIKSGSAIGDVSH